MASIRMILEDGTEKIYRHAKMHQEKGGALQVVREGEMIALGNIVEPEADCPCDWTKETTRDNETIAYFPAGSYTSWETIAGSV